MHLRALTTFAAVVLAAPFLPVLGTAPAMAAAPRAAAPIVTCGGVTATIVGTPGDDVINGTSGNDVINGLGGNDVINGLGGDDRICGADGNNTLNGGDGNDFFFPDGGNDNIDGGTGFNDVSYQFSSNGVQVDLSAGRATGDGTDTLKNVSDVTGSRHNDQLIGDSNNNIIIGGGGSDTLAGGAGHDQLVVSGGAGPTFLIGGPGDDTIQGDGVNSIADYLDCTGLDVNLQTGNASCGGQGNDTLFNVDNVLGSQFDDTIVGNDNANRIFGEGGNDTISGLGGDDFIDGGDGDDTIDAGAGADTASFADAVVPVVANIGAGVATGAGNDTITNFEGLLGSSLNDVLIGGPGDDTIDGGLGDDTINGVAGNDTATFATSTQPVNVDLSAGTANGEGNDALLNLENIVGSSVGGNTLRGNDQANRITAFANDTIEGRGGDDVLHDSSSLGITLSYASAPSGVTVNGDAHTASGGAGNDSFDFLPSSLIGSAFDDQLSCSGALGACFVDGGAGNDTITGTFGNDTLRGNTGNDRIVGNGGTDTADFTTGTAVNVNLATGRATGQGTDTLVGMTNVEGSSHNDTIVGPPTGTCTLDGNAGDDHMSASTPAGCTFNGGAGNDTITGTPGNDFMSGQDGSDTVSGAAGNDTVFGDVGNDHLHGGPGIDLLDYSQAFMPLNADLAGGVVTGLGSDAVSGFENFNGGFGDDTIRGTSGANVINGGLGDDTIFGHGGNDTLIGGDGNDTINGENGNDIIEGDNGNDKLDGGPGIDTVSYANDFGGVTVDLTANIAFATGVDTLSGFENITGSFFDDTLTGNTGPNVIDGGFGTDVCDGAGGADTLLNCP